MTHVDSTLSFLATTLGSASLKATAILAVAPLIARLLHRQPAAVRHLMWTVALGSTVALLVLPALLPAWRIVPLTAVSSVIANSPASQASEPPRATPSAATPRAAGATVDLRRAPAAQRIVGQVAPPAARPAGASLPLAIVAVWLTGVIALAARYAWSRVELARLARSSREVAQPGVLAERALQSMHITRSVSIRMSDSVDLPLTWGIAHPLIVVPVDAVEWTPDCWRHVLEHELAHVKRLDAATQLVAHAAQALFWFHPLVWYGAREMRRERERACDDCVLEGGAVASDYATDLLALVTNRAHVDRHTVALAFARRSQFEGRLLALLDPTIDRGVLTPRRIAIAVGLSVAFVAPLAAIQTAAARPVRQTTARTVAKTPLPAREPTVTSTVSAPASLAKHTSSQSLAPVTAIGSGSPQPGTRADAKRSLALDDIFTPCAAEARHGESHHDSDFGSHGDADRVWTANGTIGGCRFDLKSEGQVSFAIGLTSIEQISAGSYFDATTDIHGDVTRLVAVGSANGTPTYEFTHNGRRVDFSAAGAVWLEQFLVGLDRLSAFAVDNRFPVLLQGGPETVLADIDRMYSDHAKSVYAERLIKSARLDPGAVRHASDIVAGMSTDHAAADLIVALADRYPLTDAPTRTALLGTALTMRIDHEQAQSIISIVGKSPLERHETLAVLQALAKINVDAEKSRALRAVAVTQRIDGDLRDAYTAAAASIRQPQQRLRALTAIP